MKKVRFGDMHDAEYTMKQYIEGLYEENTNHKKRQIMLHVAETGIYVFLTPKQRYCVECYYKKGEDVKVIAERMGITRSAVYKHLKAAEKQLKKLSIFLPV